MALLSSPIGTSPHKHPVVYEECAVVYISVAYLDIVLVISLFLL